MDEMIIQKLTDGQAHSPLYDPDLPTAADVLAAISCVSAQHAVRPNLDLAKLASQLAYKLSAPEYNESCLIAEVARRLVYQWDEVVRVHQRMNVKSTQSERALHALH